MHFLIGFIVSLAFGLVAYWKKSVSISGLWSGVFVGTLLYGFSGPQGFCLLAFLFIVGSLLTRHGFNRKQAMEVAQPNEGRRGTKEALANCLPGVLFAFLLWRGGSSPWAIGLVSSFAAALADTTATELGQLYGKRFMLLPGFKPVPAGTRGACSAEGTVFGLLAALAMGFLGWLLGFFPAVGMIWVLLGATIGFMGESLMARWVSNHEARNFSGAFLGGVSGAIFSRLLS